MENFLNIRGITYFTYLYGIISIHVYEIYWNDQDDLNTGNLTANIP
jgi:hypothetical protein